MQSRIIIMSIITSYTGPIICLERHVVNGRHVHRNAYSFPSACYAVQGVAQGVACATDDILSGAVCTLTTSQGIKTLTHLKRPPGLRGALGGSACCLSLYLSLRPRALLPFDSPVFQPSHPPTHPASLFRSGANHHPDYTPRRSPSHRSRFVHRFLVSASIASQPRDSLPAGPTNLPSISWLSFLPRQRQLDSSFVPVSHLYSSPFRPPS